MGEMLTNVPDTFTILAMEQGPAQARPPVSLTTRVPERAVAPEELTAPAQLAVPSFTALFVFLTVQVATRSIYDEKRVGSFRRLLPSLISKANLLIGKILPSVIACLIQVAVMLGLGMLVLPLLGPPAFNSGNAPLAVALVALLMALCSSGPGILIAVMAAHLDALLQAYQQATRYTTTVNTGGGACVGGNVDVKGSDFVGLDKHITITIITGNGNVIGDHGSSTVIKQQGANAEALARAFAAFYTAVQRKPDLPPEDKEDRHAELQEVETLLQKGGEAREAFIRWRLRNVARMVPDIYDLVLTTFANLVARLGLVAKKVTEKMKTEAG